MSEYIAAKTAIASPTGPRNGPRTKAPTPANIKKIETIQTIAPNIVNIFFISFLLHKSNTLFYTIVTDPPLSASHN